MKATLPNPAHRPALDEAQGLLAAADVKTPSPVCSRRSTTASRVRSPAACRTAGSTAWATSAASRSPTTSRSSRAATRPGDARLYRRGGGAGEFGSLMQRFPARHLSGLSVRDEAALRSEEVADSAGLWLRADGVPDGMFNRMLFFENMSDRAVRGTTSWARHRIETRLSG